MSKYTFTSDFVPDQLDRVNTATRITHEFEAESLDLVLSQFTDFLRGCGYHFKGTVLVVDDYPVEEEK